jgi:hypothetical protein
MNATILKLIVLALVLLAPTGCGNATQAPSETPAASQSPATALEEMAAQPTEAAATLERAAQRFPDILDAKLVRTANGTFDVTVTVSSPYDTPERYADGWRVLALDGTVLGEHTLLHDHANEQPFTRTQAGLTIPDGADTVTIEGRDKANGYGGKSVTVPVPQR